MDNLFLDETSVKVLSIFVDRKLLTLHDLCVKMDLTDVTLAPYVLYLKNEHGYLEVDPTFASLSPNEMERIGDSIAVDTPLRLSHKGRLALKMYSQTTKQHRIDEIRAWTTLFIAFAALIISIVALLLK